MHMIYLYWFLDTTLLVVKGRITNFNSKLSLQILTHKPRSIVKKSIDRHFLFVREIWLAPVFFFFLVLILCERGVGAETYEIFGILAMDFVKPLSYKRRFSSTVVNVTTITLTVTILATKSYYFEIILWINFKMNSDSILSDSWKLLILCSNIIFQYKNIDFLISYVMKKYYVIYVVLNKIYYFLYQNILYNIFWFDWKINIIFYYNYESSQLI